MDLPMVSIERFDQSALGNQLAYALLYPSSAELSEDGLKVTFKEVAGVLKVLLSAGFCCSDAHERFVENTNEPLLLCEGRNRNGKSGKLRRVKAALCAAS